MGLFDNTKSIVGIFDNDTDVDKAVQQLHDQGYGQNEDDITIIDGNRLDQEMPVDHDIETPVMPSGSGPGYGGAPVAMPVDPGQDATPSKGNLRGIEDAIKSAGVDNEEAQFFAQQVTRGSKLVIVKVSQDDAQQVKAIFDGASQTATS